jgi:molybdenum cofactor guanylyltransferase
MTTPICGLVLAGGQGRRMGGIDKGLASLHGRPLVAHVVERLRPQVERLLISANRNIDTYAAFGEVVADRVADFAGPLAGLDAGLHACPTPLLVTVPCDAPFLPADLVARLAAARAAADADVAIARTGAQVHPVFALVSTRVRSQLAEFLARGERKAQAWTATLRVVEVAFDDVPEAFTNLNTRAELAQHDA